jgi:hypothetical protein
LIVSKQRRVFGGGEGLPALGTDEPFINFLDHAVHYLSLLTEAFFDLW